MKSLDGELRNLFQRKEPPAGFAGRVRARLGTAPPQMGFIRRTAGLWRRPILRWAAVGAACLLVTLGVAEHRRQEQRRIAAERASQQAILALRIASTKLNMALERAQRVTVQALASSENPKTRME
jgi:hypothetical protein